MFYHWLNNGIKVLTVFLLAVLVVIVPVEVFLRYCFGKSLYITEDLTRYLMVWVVFLASSLALRENLHVSIEILVKRFKGRARGWFHLISQVLLLTFLIFLIVEGVIALTYQMGQIIPTLGIPIFWFYLAIPVGSMLMILNLLPKIWESLKIISGKGQAVEAKKILQEAEPGGFI